MNVTKYSKHNYLIHLTDDELSKLEKIIEYHKTHTDIKNKKKNIQSLFKEYIKLCISEYDSIMNVSDDLSELINGRRNLK